jgi:rhodanese-related sulfurtransferase
MKTISAADVQKMRDAEEDFLLVHTLDAENYAATKIPGAKNIPKNDNDFTAKVEQQASSKDKTIVVYCANSRCNSSAQGARI